MDNGLMTNREELRQMDAFIAEKCMGYEPATFDTDAWAKDGEVFYFHPTENMTDAWPVFEWLLENMLRSNLFDDAVALIQLDDKSWAVAVIYAGEIVRYLPGGKTAPLAICKAAVAAVQEIERRKK